MEVLVFNGDHHFVFYQMFEGKGTGDKGRESTQSHWGVVVIPKTVHKNRMEQNFDIWDFSLTQDEMEKIDALDMGHSNIVDHNNTQVYQDASHSRGSRIREKCRNFLM